MFIEDETSEGYIVDTLRNHVFIQTEKGYKAVVDTIKEFNHRIHEYDLNNAADVAARLRANREKYVNAITEWEDKKLTKETDNMTASQTTYHHGLTETKTDDEFKVVITSEDGVKLSVAVVGSIHQELNGSRQIDPKRHLTLLDRLGAHMAAQREWIARPVVNHEALLEIANYLVDYGTIPAYELTLKYPALTDADDGAINSFWAKPEMAKANGFDNVDHARLNWFIVPAVKRALGLTT